MNKNTIENYNLIETDGGLPTADQVIDHLEIQRAKFEKWMSGDGFIPWAIERDEEGLYRYIVTLQSWKVWQAAINAQ